MSNQKLRPFGDGISNGKQKDESIIEIPKLFKNKKNINEIVNYLTDYKVGGENPTKGIIVRGNTGCGKLTLLKACIKHTNYTPIYYDSDNDIDNNFENILKTLESKGFYKLFGNAKRVLVITDIDNILKQSEKTVIFKLLGTSKNTIPLLMTSSDRSVGVTREVPKYVRQLEFENPSITELVKYFGTTNISSNALEKLIKDSNFDLRYIKGIVENVGTTKINVSKIKNYIKDFQLDTFNSIDYCIANKETETIDNKLTHTSMYTNNTVFQNYPNMTDDIKVCAEVAELCSISKCITDYMYETQTWEMFDDYSNILGTIAPLEHLTKKIKYVYPSSNLMVTSTDTIPFNVLERESMELSIIMGRNDTTKSKDINNLRYPINACKLSNISKNTRAVSNITRELKKLLIKDD